MSKFQLATEEEIHGHIAWNDKCDDEFPTFVINNKKISWEELGHELMIHEGFHFTLKVYEK